MEGGGERRGMGVDQGQDHRECREVLTVCAVKEPQSQELLESCEAWKPWQTPGGGGSEAAGVGEVGR